MELIKYNFNNFLIIARSCTLYERISYLLIIRERNPTQTNPDKTVDVIDSPPGREIKRKWQSGMTRSRTQMLFSGLSLFYYSAFPLSVCEPQSLLLF